MDYIWGDATTLECGCVFEKTEVGYIMHWCPKHKAADDMYEALKEALSWLEAMGVKKEFRWAELNKALTLAEGG